MCIFYNKEKRSCTIYPVRPLLCKIYPVQFYLNNDKNSDLFNINSNCSAIERECKEKNSNFQPNEYAVLGQKKPFTENSKYLEYDSYRIDKLNVFMCVWSDLFIDPAILTPEIVKGYQRLDMSYFWEWILENKNNIRSIRGIRAKIKQYKESLSKFHELYNFTINSFIE